MARYIVFRPLTIEYVEVLPIYYSEEGKKENTQHPWDIGRYGMHTCLLTGATCPIDDGHRPTHLETLAARSILRNAPVDKSVKLPVKILLLTSYGLH